MDIPNITAAGTGADEGYDTGTQLPLPQIFRSSGYSVSRLRTTVRVIIMLRHQTTFPDVRVGVVHRADRV